MPTTKIMIFRTIIDADYYLKLFRSMATGMLDLDLFRLQHPHN